MAPPRGGRAAKKPAPDPEPDDGGDTNCERCNLGDDEPNLVLCDDCPRGWHVYCLRPKLSHVPKGRWACPTCDPGRVCEGGRGSSAGGRAAAATRGARESPAPASGDRAKRRKTAGGDADARSTRRTGARSSGISDDDDENADADADDDEEDAADDDELRTVRCVTCDLGDDEQKMILCDGCDAGHHLYCLRPKLSQVPRGKWFCPACEVREDARRKSAEETAATKALRLTVAEEYVKGRHIEAILGSRLVPEATTAARRACPTRGPAFTGRPAEVEFLVKFEFASRRKTEWIPGSVCEVITEGKLRYFWKRHNASWEEPAVSPEFQVDAILPEKVVAVDANGKLALVKWVGEGYEEATWEPLDDAKPIDVKHGVTVTEDAFVGKLVEGGGNASIAESLADELAAFNRRSKRTKPKLAWNPTKEVQFNRDVLPALNTTRGSDGVGQSSASTITATNDGAKAADVRDMLPGALNLHAYQRDGVRWCVYFYLLFSYAQFY